MAVRRLAVEAAALLMACAALAGTPERGGGLVGAWSADGADLGGDLALHHVAAEPGKMGKALRFDGKRSYASRPHAELDSLFPAASPQAARSFTVAAWIRLASLGHRNPIAGKQENEQRGFMFMVEADDRLAIEIWRDARAATKLRTPHPLQRDRWYHVAVVYRYVADKESRAALFVDGTLATQTDQARGPVAANTAPFEIGRYHWSRRYSVCFHGLIDEVRVYGRALSSPEVRALARTAAGARWPQFRGPSGDSLAPDSPVPDNWDEAAKRNVRWRVPVPVPGASSPIVWDGRLFLTGADATRREVFCFQAATGTLLWRKPVRAPGGSPRQKEHFEGLTYAAPTPVCDDARVYALFGNGDIASFHHNGTPAWTANLGLPHTGYSLSASLALHGGLLIVDIDQGLEDDPASRLLALDRRTGSIVWEKKGREHPVGDSWSSPILIATPHGDQLVTRGGGAIIARDPANGRILWTRPSERGDVSTSPLFTDGLVIAGGYDGKTEAIRTDGRLAWTSEDGPPDVASPVAIGGVLLLLNSSGLLTGLDVATGRKLLEHEIGDEPGKGHFFATPLVVGDRVYALREDGTTIIFRIAARGGDRAFQRLGIGRLTRQELCWASPAVADGALFLRSKTHLYCIQGSAKAPKPVHVAKPQHTQPAAVGKLETGPTGPTRTASWPQHRGPNRNGITTEHSGWTGSAWPLKKLWQVNVKEGCTSPILADGRVYAMGWQFTRRSRDRRNPHGTDTVTCLDARTGTTLWTHTYEQPRYCRHHTYDETNYGGPNATPTLDQSTGLLYTHGIDGDFRCLDVRADGKLVWHMNIYDAYDIPQNPGVYPKTHNNDYGCISSPLLYGPWVIIEVGSPRHGLLMAFHKRTGRRAWASQLKTWAGQTPGPQLITVGGTPCLATLTLEHLVIMRLDPGHEGHTLTRFPWKSGWDENLALPAVQGNRVLLTGYHYINGGRNDGASAILEVTPGRITQRWKKLPCSKATGGTLHKGYAYIGSDNFHCLHADNGAERWRDPDVTGDDFGCGATVVITGDEKLIYFSERNTLYLAEPGHRAATYTRLAKVSKVLNPSKGHTWPHVVLAEGKILVKDKTGNLACYAAAARPGR